VDNSNELHLEQQTCGDQVHARYRNLDTSPKTLNSATALEQGSTTRALQLDISTRVDSIDTQARAHDQRFD
jgi:hypothetical protein